MYMKILNESAAAPNQCKRKIYQEESSEST